MEEDLSKLSIKLGSTLILHIEFTKFQISGIFRNGTKRMIYSEYHPTVDECIKEIDNFINNFYIKSFKD